MSSKGLTGNDELDLVLDWCGRTIGTIELLSDHTRHHPGDRTATLRVGSAQGIRYIKIHRTRDRWAQEVHGYEKWAPFFGAYAPKLLAVLDEGPLALVVSAIEGKPLDEVDLTPEKETAVWMAAGRALNNLHQSAVGDHFGPCDREGNVVAEPVDDAVTYIAGQLQLDLDKGTAAGHLTPEEQNIIRGAIDLTPVYTDVRPVPCHRDYCPPNLLVTEAGEWAGVIDFEFAHWDVAATDFARDANWTWLHRPEMVEAFYEGYGRDRVAEMEQQILVCLIRYGLSAIVWGMDNDYFGFAREGREALVNLAPKILSGS